MDYRYYRGDLLELPPAITKSLHLLRFIGTLMIAAPPVLAVLMLVHIIQLNLFWFFASFLLGTFGNAFLIIGLTYNTKMDRSSRRGVIWKLLFPGKRSAAKSIFDERKMIYNHYEAPDMIRKDD
jgi:hypothetical protein